MPRPTPRFPTRVLLAVDGSASSDLARDHALALVHDTRSELHVLHVGLLSAWTNSKTLNREQRDRVEQEARVMLDAEVAHLRTVDPGLDLHEHVRVGRAVDQILRLRDEIEADLIVLGSRGLNTFTRVLLGSDAESVVRHAPCPVLVVRRDR
ncbi:universal stress protein [Nocardioidaceae bacterium]|nr:universal stress protein [Nocardioidaceae bacterium]